MSPRLLRRITAGLVFAALQAGVCAQTSGDGDEAPPEVSAKERSAAAIAALDARSVAVHQQLATVTDPNERFRLLFELSEAFYRAGRVPESLKVSDEIIEDKMIGPGRRSLRASAMALNMSLVGEYAKSQRYVNRAKSLARETSPAELEELPREPSFSFLHAEAEIYRRSEGRHDLALAKTRETAELAWASFNDSSLSEKRRQAAASELLSNVNVHVRLLVQNNRRDEAMSYITEIRERIATRPDLKASSYQMASIDEALAIALSSQDDYDAALVAIDSAVARHTRLKTPEFDVNYGLAMRGRLMITLALGRIGDYGRDADALTRGRGGSPILAGSFPSEESDSLAFASRGQWSEAATRIGSHLDRDARRIGTESPFYKYRAAMLLLYLINDPARPEAQPDIERFVAALANDDGDWADASYRGSYVEDGALSSSLGKLIPAGGRASDSAVALAFRISELLRSSSSQGALADGASRLAASNPKLRGLIEQEQALRFDRNASRGTFSIAVNRLERARAPDSGDEAIAKRREVEVADKGKAVEASNAKLKQLRREISAQFPVYRELVSPSVPSAAKIGAVLKPGEVYLNLYSGASAGYAFVVQPGGKLSATRLDITRAKTKSLIATLRRPFDASTPPERAGDLGGFDLAASRELYAAWLAPVKDQLQGATTVYISAGGPLASLPWSVLVTQPAKTLAEASWWVSQISPVQMPSASSLVLARTYAGQRAKRPFFAFADPSFDGREVAPATAGTTRGVRASALAPNTAPQGAEYKSLNRLPETFDEARAIGASLDAGDDSVIRGQAASRSRVMKENLSDVRVVEFATHGLLPGELPGMLRAGLALAYEGQGTRDSVLTIDDIVGLRLNADWVILSACNTGLASGTAGDSMSSLARGFFAAGARTVLATQWAVESQSAKELTVGLFKSLGADPASSKADALSKTQREMIAGKYGALYKHPYFWAPFFISGDAAR